MDQSKLGPTISFCFCRNRFTLVLASALSHTVCIHSISSHEICCPRVLHSCPCLCVEWNCAWKNADREINLAIFCCKTNVCFLLSPMILPFPLVLPCVALPSLPIRRHWPPAMPHTQNRMSPMYLWDLVEDQPRRDHPARWSSQGWLGTRFLGPRRAGPQAYSVPITRPYCLSCKWSRKSTLLIFSVLSHCFFLAVYSSPLGSQRRSFPILRHTDNLRKLRTSHSQHQ